jgi:type VI protein secretion system component VasK
MKKSPWVVAILLILVLLAAAGCVPGISREQADRLQYQIDALKSSIYATQQEAASIKNSISIVQEQTKELQSQVQDIVRKNAETTTVAAPVYVSPYYLNSYPWYSRSYNYYPRPWPRPFPPVPPHPPLPRF